MTAFIHHDCAARTDELEARIAELMVIGNLADMEIERNALIAENARLRQALEFVKAFFTGLEDNTEPGDPLIEIRRAVHAPLHQVIEAALARIPEAG